MVGVYLAGAIRFSPEEEQYDRDWRTFVQLSLHDEFSNNVTIYDPIRDESYKGEGTWKLYDGKFKSTPNMILHKDLAAIKQSDIIFMNLIPFNVGHPNVGTFMELGIAVAERKLLVVITDNFYLANYPLLTAAVTAQFSNVEMGVEFTKGLIRTLIGQ